jgi:hypothetical protein
MAYGVLKLVLNSLKSLILSFRHLGINLERKRGELISITLVLFVIFITATRSFFPDDILVQFLEQQKINLPKSIDKDLFIQSFKNILFIITAIYGLNTFNIIFVYVGDRLKLLNPKKIIVNIVDFSLVFNLFSTNLLFLGLIISAWLLFLKDADSIGFLVIIILIMLLFSVLLAYLPLIVILLWIQSFCEHVFSEKNILTFASVVEKSIKSIGYIFFCFINYILWFYPKL